MDWKKIHCLTTREDMELRIELGNGSKPSIVWTYQLFKVGGAETNYRLTIGQGQGVGGTHNAMAYHNGRSFTTPDRDNDGSNGNCAVGNEGGWWYYNCSHTTLNGNYTSSNPGWYNGSRWVKFTKIQMKIFHYSFSYHFNHYGSENIFKRKCHNLSIKSTLSCFCMTQLVSDAMTSA